MNGKMWKSTIRRGRVEREFDPRSGVLDLELVDNSMKLDREIQLLADLSTDAIFRRLADFDLPARKLPHRGVSPFREKHGILSANHCADDVDHTDIPLRFDYTQDSDKRVMSKVIVFANQKGGVGKTTTTANLGAYLAELGRRVLLIDFDPQCNLSSSVGVVAEPPGIYDALNAGSLANGSIRRTGVERLDIVPSTVDLAGATVELVEERGRETFLKRVITHVAEEYDFVFVDCPPSLGLLTVNGLVAADSVIVPLQCEYFAMEGLTQLLQSIKRVQSSLNPSLDLLGILFTMYDSRTRLAQDVVQEVISYFGKRVFRTIIPRNVRLSEAPSHGIPINKYDPDCVGAKSYRTLAEEVLERV